MNLVSREKTSHWYLKSGEPFVEVECKTKPGKMRPVNIRDAKAAGAYPSVTNMLSTIGKPELVAWKLEQAILSSLTLPRQEGEELADYAKRVVVDMDAEAKAAAERGSLLHDSAAAYLTSGAMPAADLLPCFMPFKEWADKEILKVVAVEKVVVSEGMEYAGRMDLLAEVCDHGYSVIDIKTQDRKGKDFTFYAEYPLQLAAYAAAAKGGYTLLTLALDRVTPGMDICVWPNKRDYWNTFCAAIKVWEHMRGWRKQS